VIAKQYLTTLFPGRRTFRFRHFDRHAEVADELAQAQIAFLTPNQLALIKPLGVDLFLNISSLHEMRPEQIAHSCVSRPVSKVRRWIRWPRRARPWI